MPEDRQAEIRLLRHTDEHVLENVADDVFDDPIDARAAREFLSDPRHHLAVALVDDVVVGFVSAVHYVHPDKERPELFINEVGVASGQRGRGLGQALMQAVLDRGRSLGCSVAWVITDRTNVAAQRLYASAGGETDQGDLVLFNFPLARGDA